VEKFNNPCYGVLTYVIRAQATGRYRPLAVLIWTTVNKTAIKHPIGFEASLTFTTTVI